MRRFIGRWSENRQTSVDRVDEKSRHCGQCDGEFCAIRNHKPPALLRPVVLAVDEAWKGGSTHRQHIRKLCFAFLVGLLRVLDQGPPML